MIPLMLNHLATTTLPTPHGSFALSAFREQASGLEHLALATTTAPTSGALVRLHSECLTGDALGSLRCDCGPQLQAALAMIAASQNGLLLYLRGHEGRGIGLGNKIRAYQLQDQGANTLEANHQLGLPTDQRDYAAAIAMLGHFQLTEIRLLTNNPAKLDALTQAGIKVESSQRLQVGSNPLNQAYLGTKRDLMGHLLP